MARSAASDVACGPAASSARVTADTASSIGKSIGSIRSSSITTDVSSIPRGWRSSRTWRWVLVHEGVDVCAEAFGLDGWRAGEDRHGGFSGDELALPERGELAD